MSCHRSNAIVDFEQSEISITTKITHLHCVYKEAIQIPRNRFKCTQAAADPETSSATSLATRPDGPAPDVSEAAAGSSGSSRRSGTSCSAKTERPWSKHWSSSSHSSAVLLVVCLRTVLKKAVDSSFVLRLEKSFHECSQILFLDPPLPFFFQL